MQLDNIWLYITSSYLAFVPTDALDKFADQWEQYEISKSELTNLALKD